MLKKIFLVVFVLLCLASQVNAEKFCAIYFTKIGCPNCNVTDPVVLGEWPGIYKELVVIEYVFTSWSEPNAIVLGEYNLSYGVGGGVPLIILNEEKSYAGRLDVFKAEEEIKTMKENKCLLLEGKESFEEMNLNDLPESPKIWANERLLVKKASGTVSSDFLKEVIFSEDLKTTLLESEYEFKEIEAEPAPYSGGSIPFEQAIMIEESWELKLKERIELPENIEPISNGGNEENGEGNENNEVNEGNPFIVPIAIGVICLIAIIFLVKVKK